jgi:hypothetical protein
MYRKLPDVDCRYGAPMGRPSYCNNPTAKVHLFRVNMSADGAYDSEGAYWGIGTPLYCARSEGDEVLIFLRAKNREDAKASIHAANPGLRFYR